MREVHIGVVQMTSRVGELQRNLDRIASFAAEAAAARVELLCFPELAVSGYAPEWDGFKPEAFPGPSTDVLARVAAHTGVTLLAGLLEQGPDGRTYNSQLVVSPQGPVGIQRKTHVPESELACFSAGSEVDLFDHGSIRFGIGVCYDAHFPELSSSLAGRGAELLFFPHASAVPESHDEKLARWSRFLPARAYDNAVFVAACNQVGPNGQGTDFVGGCLILDPLGDVIARSKGPGEELITATLTPDVLHETRTSTDGYFRRYRRPDLYARIADEAVSSAGGESSGARSAQR